MNIRANYKKRITNITKVNWSCSKKRTCLHLNDAWVIQRLFTGPDSVQGVADVKTSKGIVRRTLHKLRCLTGSNLRQQVHLLELLQSSRGGKMIGVNLRTW
ncbi:unnamed protein product, partial [Iphiclides podalirius]